MGIDVLAPSINESFEEFAVIPDESGREYIRFGLNAIKNVGKTVTEEIVAERKRGGKFTSLANFVERVHTKDLNKKSIEALAKVGGLDAFGERAQILASIDKIIQHAKNLQKIQETHQSSLFGSMPIAVTTLILNQAAPATKKQKLQWEKELLGLYVSDHPVSEFLEYFARVATPINELDKRDEGTPVTIGGVIATVKKILTKADKSMFFANIEDLTGRTEALVFPRVAEATETVWVADAIVVISGKITKKDGTVKVIVEGAETITEKTIETFARALATKQKYETVSQPADTSAVHESAPKGYIPSSASASTTSSIPESEPSSRLILELRDELDPGFLQTLSFALSQHLTGPTSVCVRLRGQLIETAYHIAVTDDTVRQLEGLGDVVRVD